MRETLTLLELNGLVRETIEVTLHKSYWVEAELQDVRDAGHCYMELIQKDPTTNTPVAKARANCWRNVWISIRPHFERVTGQRLRSGMKVRLLVHATFHENYGFSWQVEDIDPEYTLGDMERKRREIIRQLKEEGVYDLQRQLPLPLFTQRIAVISSASAAGYGDFVRQLGDNAMGLLFYVRLFPAVMLGEMVEQSIIAALDAIHAMGDCFDAVVIIRGGGATSDLSGFDTLALAENVANFPLPIITGIGHDRDESVLDLVAHQHLKTPTAVAVFLVDHLADVYHRVEDARAAISNSVVRRMQLERMSLARLTDKLPALFANVRTRQQALLEALCTRMRTALRITLRDEAQSLRQYEQQTRQEAQRRLADERHRLDLLAQRLQMLDPQTLLRRGYSITLRDGKAVRDADSLRAGDEIQTRLANGTVKSVIS